MNQLPVRSKGAGGRAFAMFAGREGAQLHSGLGCRRLALSAAGAGAGAGAGAVLHAETATLAAVTIATAIRLKLELMMVCASEICRATSTQACRDEPGAR